MSSTPHPPLTRDEIQKHNRVLLHALQTAHPMLHNGRRRFIHTLTFTEGSIATEATVYLRGHGEVSAHELTVDRDHDPAGTIGRKEIQDNAAAEEADEGES